MSKYLIGTMFFEERILLLEMKSPVKDYGKGLLIIQSEQYTATVKNPGLCFEIVSE